MVWQFALHMLNGGRKRVRVPLCMRLQTTYTSSPGTPITLPEIEGKLDRQSQPIGHATQAIRHWGVTDLHMDSVTCACMKPWQYVKIGKSAPVGVDTELMDLPRNPRLTFATAGAALSANMAASLRPPSSSCCRNSKRDTHRRTSCQTSCHTQTSFSFKASGG